jgi:hypothetical protein
MMAHKATDAENLKHWVDTLRETIWLDWRDLAEKRLSEADRAKIRKSPSKLSVELIAFIQRLDQLNPGITLPSETMTIQPGRQS